MREDKGDIKRDEDSGVEQEKWEAGGGKVTRTIHDLEMRKEAERDKFVGCEWIRVIVGLNLLQCANHDRNSLESTTRKTHRSQFPGKNTNHSRERTLYLIKRANQGQIHFNKLQGQTTEWV